MDVVSNGIDMFREVFTAFWEFALEHDVVFVVLLLAIIGSGIWLFLSLKD